MAGRAIYIVDTSSWLYIEEHPDSNRILDAISRLVEFGRVVSPPEVFDEFERIEDISGWLKLNKSSIMENHNSDVEYLLLAGRIAHKYPAMAGVRGAKNKADPFVVALAVHKSKNPERCIVVCDETLNKRPNRKIPTACRAENIECKTLLEVLRDEFPGEGW